TATEAIRIGKSLLHQQVDAGHDVEVILISDGIQHGFCKCLPVTPATAWVREEDQVPFLCQSPAKGAIDQTVWPAAVRAAVKGNDRRHRPISPAASWWPDENAIQIKAVAVPGDNLLFPQFDIIQHGMEVGDPPGPTFTGQYHDICRSVGSRPQGNDDLAI